MRVAWVGAAALLLCGCGAEVTVGSAPTSSAPAPATATPTGASPTGADPTGADPTTGAASRTGGGAAITRPPSPGSGSASLLPAGFPLPPGASAGPVAVAGGTITATLTIPDGKQGYDYWIRRLPAAGYEIPGAQLVGGIGQISFTGNGCADGSRLGMSGQTVSFECRRG